MSSELAHLQNSTKIPGYVAVYESLYRRIVTGALQPGEQLPAETTLAEEYGISRGSLRQALAILREDGLIYNMQGKGNFVRKTANPGEKCFSDLSNPIYTCADRPIDQARMSYSFQAPADIVREKLRLSRSDLVLVCNATFFSEEQAISHGFYEIPAVYLLDAEVDVGDVEQIREFILRGIYSMAGSSKARVTVSAAEEEAAEYLGVLLGTMLVFSEEVLHSASGEPFALCKYYFLPEHYSIQVNRK